jgi:hypothetical protein
LQAVRERGAQDILPGGNFVGGRTADGRPRQREEKNRNKQNGSGRLIVGHHKM